MKPVVVAAVVVGLVCIGGSAFSWSPETHLYVGCRVLKDVSLDSSVNLCGAGDNASSGLDCARRYRLPAVVAGAIRQFPEAYLAGTLGPDVYPDFLSGQVTVHPGVRGGWQADEWLYHLLTSAISSGEPIQIAWTFGYASHMAGDIFGHTWVNQYAGDIFDIGSHIDPSNEVELRHFTLERYIADRTERLWNKMGLSPKAPHEFVADQLILNKAVANQYRVAVIPAHLVAIQALHELVSQLHDEAKLIEDKILENALIDLGPLSAAEQALAQAESSLKIAQEALKGIQHAMAELDKLISKAEEKLAQITKQIAHYEENIRDWQVESLSLKEKVKLAEESVTVAKKSVEEARKLVEKLKKALAGIPETVGEKVCEKLGPLEWLCKLVLWTNPDWTTANRDLELAQKALKKQEEALDAAEKIAVQARKAAEAIDNKIAEANEAITKARILETTVKTTLGVNKKAREVQQKLLVESQNALAEAKAEVGSWRAKVAELNDKLKPVKELLARYAPLAAFLAHWRNDIRKAAIAFSRTSETIAVRMIEKSGETRLGLYQEWYECWAPVLIAVPSEATQTACTAAKEYEDLKDRLYNELDEIVDRLGVVGWVLIPGVKLQREFEKKVKVPLEKEAIKALKKARDELIAFTANRELATLVQEMDSAERITDAKLNSTFETDDSHKDLLEIGDLAVRVRFDSGLVHEDAQILEEKFAALYDSVVLSKLALLDASTLNMIHRELSGGKPTVFGSSLYPSDSDAAFSLLVGSVRSIDGNHQWQAVALPYPRRIRNDPGWPDERRYGRELRSADSGFRLWGDRVSREIVFKRIFKGPLNPGLDNHPDVRRHYLFPSCAANPFPSTTDDSGRLVQADFTCKLVAEPGSGVPGKFSAISIRPFKRSELTGIPAWNLKIARNEIFARYGYSFGPSELATYFQSQPWYQPNNLSLEQISKKLTNIEWHNISVIQSIESSLQTDVCQQCCPGGTQVRQ